MSTEVTQTCLDYMQFMESEIDHIHEDEDPHIHPAPAMMAVYSRVLRNMDIEPHDEENFVISDEDLIVVLDMVARFSSNQALKGKPYHTLTRCQCFTLTDEDIANLRNEV